MKKYAMHIAILGVILFALEFYVGFKVGKDGDAGKIGGFLDTIESIAPFNVALSVWTLLLALVVYLFA